MRGRYDFSYAEGGTYDRAVSLLSNVGISGDVHLDIGCAYGVLKPSIIARLNVAYIGIDCDEAAVDALHGESTEAYRYCLGQADDDHDYEFLDSVLNGRKLTSVTVLDMLEHLPDPEKTVRVLHRLCLKYGAPLAISVPNITHKDIAFKLLAGDFDYTDTGLLDRTHLSFFSEKRLSSMMNSLGFYEIAALDSHYGETEQRFPGDHVFLSKATSINQVLGYIKSAVDPCADTYQFVRAYMPKERAPDIKETDAAHNGTPPFLSVVTRTQGRRLEAFREMLLCLSAQTDTDFEILILGHLLDASQGQLIRQIIDETPEWLRERIRYIPVDHGNRTAPLNVGFEAARGVYTVILDDDDIVFSNWVAEFHQCSLHNSGRVLHAYSLVQDWEILESGALRAISPPRTDYCRDYDVFSQLTTNSCPPIGLAFPSFAFHRLNIRFDETLTTAEDWDYLMRTACICGVTDIQIPTGIYRRWTNGESSLTVHSREEWTRNEDAIRAKLENIPFLQPSGARVRESAIRLQAQNETTAQHEDRPSEPVQSGSGLSGGSSEEKKHMHDSSKENMRRFVEKHVRGGTRVLDVGSREADGQFGSSYRSLFDGKNIEYIGCDIAPGHNVDVVLKSPYAWNELKANSYDFVISGQMLEHVEFPWLSLLEVQRVLKPGGICCIIAPSSGPMHNYPLDCYRYYPDGMAALAGSAHLDVLDVYVNWDYGQYPYLDRDWKDCVLIAQKGTNARHNAKAAVKRLILHWISPQSLKPLTRPSLNPVSDGGLPENPHISQPLGEDGLPLSRERQRTLFNQITAGKALNDLERFFAQKAHLPIHKALNYFEVYDRFFSRYRGTPVVMMEIGVGAGGSLQMWRDYFGPSARIIGVDVNPDCKRFEEPGTEIYIGDQADIAFLHELAQAVGPFDILLDDGGHRAEQQNAAFRELFPHLRSDGLYLCEDLHTSYWSDFGGGYLRPGTFVETSKSLIDAVNAWHSESDGLQPDYYTRHIKGLHFYSGIVVIEKGTQPGPPEILQI